MRLIAIILFLSFLPQSALARPALGDWKYRTYTCNAVMTYLVLFSQMDEGVRRQLMMNDAVMEDYILDDLANGSKVVSDTYKFDQQDAKWIALLVTSMKEPLTSKGGEITPLGIMRIGHDVCIGIFDKLHEESQKLEAR